MSKKTQQTNVPKIEDDPNFKQRMQQALGGAASSPQQYRGIGALNAPPEVTTSPDLQTPFARNVEKEQQYRAVQELSQGLHTLALQLHKGVQSLTTQLDAVTPDVAKAHDFDLATAKDFLQALESALKQITS